MIIRIYVEHEFAVVQETTYSLTVKVNANRSLLVAYDSSVGAWQRTYLSLNELLQDNDLRESWKWLARGMLGIPLELIKKEAG